MPDPPIMPSTATVMTSPDVLAAAPYSTNVVWPQVTSLIPQGKADVHHERPGQGQDQASVDHRCLPGHESARHKQGDLRQYQPAAPRRDADHPDQHAL